MQTVIDGDYLVTTLDSGTVIRELNRAPLASANPILSKVDILRRITSAEWNTLETSTLPDARYALAVFNNAPQVDRNDPLTIALFGKLETIGILAAGRAAEILA